MTRRGAFILLVVVIAVFSSPVWSDPAISSVHFLPPEYFVGDRVELRVLIENSGESPIHPPASLPQTEWLIFKEARVNKTGDNYELRIFFSSFAPGTRTLPEISFGGFALKGMKIHTSSIIDDEGSDIADIRGQLYLPGTVPMIVVIIVALFAGPVAIIAASGLVRHRLRSLVLFINRRRPYWRLKRDLKELASQSFYLSDRDYYYRLSDAVRRYISRRTARNCITATIHEIRAIIQPFFTGNGISQRVIGFLEYADTIKFAGVEAGAEQKAEDLLQLREIASRMEEAYRRYEKGTEKVKKEA